MLILSGAQGWDSQVSVGLSLLRMFLVPVLCVLVCGVQQQGLSLSVFRAMMPAVCLGGNGVRMILLEKCLLFVE